MHKTKTKPETKPNFSLSLNLCVCVYTTTTKQKKNLLIRKHKLNYWMSSALAAQMYAAQLSSQQQQNMYVKSSSCSKTNSKNKPNIFPKSAPENCPFLESANIGIVKMMNWTMFFFFDSSLVRNWWNQMKRLLAIFNSLRSIRRWT